MRLGAVAALVLAGCGGGGSSSNAGYIDVTVDVDQALLASLDQVVIRADAPSRPEFTKTLTPSSTLTWTIAVLNVNADFVAQLAADGKKSNALVLTYKAQASVSAGQHTAATLKLTSACAGAGAPTCPATETCDSGACVQPPMFGHGGNDGGGGSDGGGGNDGGGGIVVTLGAPTALVRHGSSQTVAVSVTRGAASGALTVGVIGLPAGVTAEALTIPAGANSGSLVLDAAASAAEGATMVTVTVTAAGGGGTGSAPLRVLVGDAPGTLDTSFAGTGTSVPTVPGMVLIGRALILDGDGVIVTGSTTTEAVTARVRADGTLDPAFGGGGVVSTGTGSFSEGIGLIKLASGRIVVVGVANGNAGFTAADFGLFGYTSDGALDPGFGSSGVANFAPGVMGFAELYSVADTGDGNLIVSGALFPADGTAISSYGVRYSTAGVRDPSFSISAGTVFVQTQALQSDGKIVLAGGTSTPDFWLARYSSTGAADTGFGTSGVVTTSFAPDMTRANGLALLPGNKLLAVGTTTATPGKVVLARYNLNGSLDLTFGVGGKVSTTVMFNTRSPNAAIVDASGRILMVGLAGTLPAVARFNSDGSTDTTFGNMGVATADFGITGTTNSTGGYGIVIDADGRILIAADIGAAGNQHMGVARFWP
jgi:uncharacterized delta-60 repeat protein